MAKVVKNPKPKWWRDLPDNEYKVAAYIYMRASFDAHAAVSKILGEKTLSGDEESLTKLNTVFAEHLEPQIKDGLSLADLANPPPLHATMYATRAYGLEKMRAAITGLGWTEILVENLFQKDAPVAPILGAVENLPDGADIEMLTQALVRAFAESLKMPKTHSNTPIIATILSVWVRKLTGEKLSDHVELQASEIELLKAKYPQPIWVLSMMPTQTIDRAARGTRGWSFPIDDVPVFEDANNKHIVT